MALVTSELPVTATAVQHGSYIDWPAIIAGAVLAAALAFVLVTFGSGLGLSMVSAEPNESVSLRWFTIAAGLWFVWIAVSTFAAGGYFAGRMRRKIGDALPDEVETRDGAHGLMVWAVGALLGTMLAASGISGVVGTAVSGAGAASGGIAELMSGPVDAFAGQALRGQNGGTLASPEARAEVASVMTRSLQAGEVTEADRTYLAQIAASQTGATPDEARATIDTTISEAQAAWQTAVDAAEQARIASVIASFVLAATLLISAAIAYNAAQLGGKHRDENVSTLVQRR